MASAYLAGRDIWVTKRASRSDAWEEGVPLGPPFNTPNIDTDPSISTDCSLLCFVSDRPGGCGAFDIWVMDAKYALIEPNVVFSPRAAGCFPRGQTGPPSR